jgi:hypothetical protein
LTAYEKQKKKGTKMEKLKEDAVKYLSRIFHEVYSLAGQDLLWQCTKKREDRTPFVLNYPAFEI